MTFLSFGFSLLCSSYTGLTGFFIFYSNQRCDGALSFLMSGSLRTVKPTDQNAFPLHLRFIGLCIGDDMFHISDDTIYLLHRKITVDIREHIFRSPVDEKGPQESRWGIYLRPRTGVRTAPSRVRNPVLGSARCASRYIIDISTSPIHDTITIVKCY